MKTCVRAGIVCAFLALALLVAVGTSTGRTGQPPEGGPIKVGGKEFKSKQDFAVGQGRRCGTRPPSVAQRTMIRERQAAFRTNNPELGAVLTALKVPVHFHVIYSGSAGRVERARIDTQMSVLNQAFQPHGVQFELVDVTETENAAWFTMNIDSAAERAAKTALGSDTKRNLNIYTGALPGGLLGWARFPWELDGDPVNDGVVLTHTCIPGPGSEPPYDLGLTAVHEVGHWLGLFHTFGDSCADVADEVDDTPAHNGPNFGTPPETTDTCPDKPGNDPVRNYMNYTDDAWMTQFTAGQVARYRGMVAQFRPLLLQPEARSKIKP